MKKITIDSYSIKNTKLDKRILVISDIHYSSKKDQDRLNELLSFLENYKCDYLVMPGDFINSAIISDEDIFLGFLRLLAKSKKIIMGIGNHDVTIYNKKTKLKKEKLFYINDNLFNEIKKIKNVHLLDNETYQTDGIKFIGLTLPSDYYKYNENKNYFKRYTNNNFKELSTKYYNILLCHTPICFEDEKVFDEVKLLSNVSLIISGHMHAGLVPRCFREKLKGKGFVNPMHKFFPKRCYGFHLIKDKKIVISPGICKFSSNTLFRFLNFMYDKELVEINLEK